MPQSSPQRRARWKDDTTAIRFLESMGYSLTPSFDWTLPSKDHAILDDEGDAIEFLMEEYDFGSIAPEMED